MAAESLVASFQDTPTADRGNDTVNQAWKNDKSKFGFRMLQKMGWTEGKGLGKNEDGMAEHVKVAKKSNNLGLGAKSDPTGAEGWASTAVSFNGVLETLGKAYGSASTSKKIGRGCSKSNTRKGDAMSKKRRKDKKRGKKGDVGVDSADADANSGSGSGSEGIGAAKAASHCPSRARRVRSKDVKAFSSADLRAILGHAAPTNNSPSPMSVGGNIRDDCGNGGGADEEKTRLAKSSKEKKKLKGSKKRSDGGEGNDDGDTPSPCRPRTRSMDLVEIEVATSSGKRRRTEQMDRTETEGQAVASRGQGDVVKASAKPASRPLGAKKKGKSAQKFGGTGAVTGEEERGEGTAAGSRKKKRKKSKSDSDPREK